MGFADQLNLRYNPHSMEKQAIAWPVLFSRPVLAEDIIARTGQIWGEQAAGWLDPIATTIAVSGELRAEYGIDACRLAIIKSGKNQVGINLLESAFKWLNNFHASWQQENPDFSPTAWLEAVLECRDHILDRNNPHAGLATIQKAFKQARPGKNLTPADKCLIWCAIYPFAPVIAATALNLATTWPVSMQQQLQEFNQLICVRFALERGGWHWRVFDRNAYMEQPWNQLRTVKWVRQATKDHCVRLEQTPEGVRICFNPKNVT
jgi:hypothetical protein